MNKRALMIFLLAVTLTMAVVGCGGGGRIGSKGLSQEAKSLQSDAAEGALLAMDAYAGKTTSIYTRVHSTELSEAAAQTETFLKNATVVPALRSAVSRLAGLADRISGSLKRLSHVSRVEQRALGIALDAAAEQSQKIGEGLQ
jgi:hypothetical protein